MKNINESNLQKSKCRKWLPEEFNQMKKYIISESQNLKSNMYINIVAGHKRFRKPRTFFIELGKIIGRSPSHCKSKFQKMENEIYLDYLKVKSEHFETFRWIRKIKSSKVDCDFKKMSNWLSGDWNEIIEAYKKEKGKKNILKVHGRELNKKQNRKSLYVYNRKKFSYEERKSDLIFSK